MRQKDPQFRSSMPFIQILNAIDRAVRNRKVQTHAGRAQTDAGRASQVHHRCITGASKVQTDAGRAQITKKCRLPERCRLMLVEHRLPAI